MNLSFVLIVLLTAGLVACSTESSSRPPDPKKSQKRQGAKRTSEPREISVAMKVPDAGWRIGIDGVYRVGKELWVVSRLSRSTSGSGMAAQVISTVEGRIRVDAPEKLPVRHFVIGKTWNWENDARYTFIDSRNQLAEKLRGAEKLHPWDQSGSGDDLKNLRPLDQERIPMH